MVGSRIGRGPHDECGAGWVVKLETGGRQRALHHADWSADWPFLSSGCWQNAGITVGVCAVSELVAHFRPRWRKYIAAVNLGAAGAHTAVTTSNVVRNPYYR